MSNNQERRSVKRIDCYDRSIHDSKIEHSLVVDINCDGAGLLLLKDQSLFQNDETKNHPDISGDVHLTIFHPDISLEKGIGIEAKIICVDYDYSDDHHRIGVSFTKAENTQLDKLKEWLSREGHYYFHCELEKL